MSKVSGVPTQIGYIPHPKGCSWSACVRIRGSLWALLLGMATLPACLFHDSHGVPHPSEPYGMLSGTVLDEPSLSANIVVAAYTGPPGDEHVVDTFMLRACESYYFILPAGTYRIAGFEDRDGDLTYDPLHERATAYRDGEAVILKQGDVRGAIDLNFQTATMQPPGFAMAALPGGEDGGKEFPAVALGVVTTLDDPRFSPLSAEDGLRQPMDFLFRENAGIYFLEPYDSRKIPVLFVHGLGGSPQAWHTVFDHLDRSRFQPWVVYYPAALPFGVDAAALDRWMNRLFDRYGFRKVIVIAHSAGGLVARGFINRSQDRSAQGAVGSVRMFVTQSTPWGGDPAAGAGVAHAPAMVPSWIDMAPESPFMQCLFRRPLPSDTQHHLLFTYGGGSGGPNGPNDGVVTLASELDRSAQHEAFRLYGFDDTHDHILDNPDAISLFNELLAATAH